MIKLNCEDLNVMVIKVQNRLKPLFIIIHLTVLLVIQVIFNSVKSIL